MKKNTYILIGIGVVIILIYRKEIERNVEDTIMKTTRPSVEESNQIIDAVKANYSYLDYIPNSLILGLIQIESNFNPNAVSNIDARGMMQMTKNAWNDVIKNYGLNYNFDQFSFDTAVNILFGMHHLYWTYLYVGKDWDRAINAYNMGVGNMKKEKWNYLYLGKVKMEALKMQASGYQGYA